MMRCGSIEKPPHPELQVDGDSLDRRSSDTAAACHAACTTWSVPVRPAATASGERATGRDDCWLDGTAAGHRTDEGAICGNHRSRSPGDAPRGRARRARSPHPCVARGVRCGRPPPGRCAHDVDEQVVGRLPAVPRDRPWQPRDRHRRPRVRRLRPRRHRLDGRALARRHGRGSAGAHRSRRRHHHDDAQPRRRVGRRRPHPPLRHAPVVVQPDGDRRQSLGAPAGPDGHRTAEGDGLLVLLPRVGRRDVRHHGRRRRSRSPRWQRRAGRAGQPDHARRRVQRHRVRRGRRWRTATSRCSSWSRR